MQRLLGLDIGERRIGVALSDPLGITAQRLTMLTRSDPASDIDRLVMLAREHDAQDVVVGLPLTMQGTVGEQAKRVLEFVEEIGRAHV